MLRKKITTGLCVKEALKDESGKQRNKVIHNPLLYTPSSHQYLCPDIW